MIIFVALVTALLAYIINTWIIRQQGLAAIAIVTPVIEETIKTMVAIGTGTPLILAHTLFGIIEGVHDLVTGGGLSSTVLSISAHFLFGLVTFWALQWGGHILVALALAGGLHSLWNAVVVISVNNSVRGG